MGAGASLKKVETLLEDIKNLPVNKFTDEMRELQVKFIFLLSPLVVVSRLLAVGFAFSHHPLTIPSDFVRVSCGCVLSALFLF